MYDVRNNRNVYALRVLKYTNYILKLKTVTRNFCRVVYHSSVFLYCIRMLNKENPPIMLLFNH
jgi:hypothetical protein